MKKELTFIVAIGKDQKGIVAKISSFLYKNNINIEDINQRIMENYFVMTMLVNISSYKKPLQKLISDLEKIGQGIGLKIHVQHENIFKMMHRV